MTRELTLSAYAVIVVAMTAYQVVAWRRGGVRVGRFVAWIAGWWPTRWALLAGWLWFGWHIFVRVGAPG